MAIVHLLSPIHPHCFTMVPSWVFEPNYIKFCPYVVYMYYNIFVGKSCKCSNFFACKLHIINQYLWVAGTCLGGLHLPDMLPPPFPSYIPTCGRLNMNSMKLVIPLHFISWKKTPNDAVTPQRQSQFTPKIKANAIPRLLSSLVWIDQYNECNGMTSFVEFMLYLAEWNEKVV